MKCFFKHKTEASYLATSLVNRARNQEAQLDVLKPRFTEERKKNTSSYMDFEPLKQQSTEHQGETWFPWLYHCCGRAMSAQ